MFIEDKTIEDIARVEKNISSSDDDSNLKLAPPTTVPREVRDEDEVIPPDVGDEDASIEIQYENDDNGVHDQSLADEVSPVPLRRSDRI